MLTVHTKNSKNMNKCFQKFFFTLVLCFFAGVLPLSTHAQLDESFEKESAFPWFMVYADASGFNTASSITDLITILISALLSLMGMIFLALVVYGGYLWLTSAGNSDMTEKGKDTIVSAVIGLLIVMGAYAISFYIIRLMYFTTQTDTSETQNLL